MKNSAAQWFYSQPGFHASIETKQAPQAQSTERAPYIEAVGGGWYAVHGGEHGPFDRHGRESAERALTAVIIGRGLKQLAQAIALSAMAVAAFGGAR